MNFQEIFEGSVMPRKGHVDGLIGQINTVLMGLLKRPARFAGQAFMY